MDLTKHSSRIPDSRQKEGGGVIVVPKEMKDKKHQKAQQRERGESSMGLTFFIGRRKKIHTKITDRRGSQEK